MSASEVGMLRLYDYPKSGNCYKVRLLLVQLGIDFERVQLDILQGETRSSDFASKNLQRKVPVLEWPDGRCLPESNAILFHLAQETRLLPSDSWHRAEVLRWLFFEQNSHEPSVAVARFWRLSGLVEERRHLLDDVMERGHRALEIMNKHLSDRDYFVGADYSIADIALYAYTHVAEEGGFELAAYPMIREWLGRVRHQPDHLTIAD